MGMIIDKRGTCKKNKEYLIRYIGWSPSCDAWLKPTEFDATLLDEWRMAQAAKIADQERFDSEQARAFAKEHARSSIRLLARTLQIKKLKGNGSCCQAHRPAASG